MEDGLLVLERRGIALKDHSRRMDAETGRLPVYHAKHGRDEKWFTTRSELDKFVAEECPEAKEETSSSTENGNGKTNGELTDKITITEFHEVRTINTGLADLAAFGLDVQSLIPQERTGIEEARFVLKRGEHETPLEDLRGLVPAIRAAGEKGLQVTRFKGLGEMNAEELRETTLDPENRTGRKEAGCLRQRPLGPTHHRSNE
jgi:DNA gyrase subunit B